VGFLYRLWWFRWRWSQFCERIQLWISWRVPRKIAYWCFIRVATYKNGDAPDPSVITIMKRWDGDEVLPGTETSCQQ
jgi:hypothetical protein